MIDKLKHTPAIYLAGSMVRGKSTIGPLLADELGWNFVDLAAAIEEDALQARVRLVRQGRPHVIVVGEREFLQQARFDLIASNGVSIWLDDAMEFGSAVYARADYRVEVHSGDPAGAVRAVLALPIF